MLNTDRHHENWAVLRKPVDDRSSYHWMAPSFDHASSLGRELTEARLSAWAEEPWRIEWYAKRARGAVFLKSEGRRGENPLHLAEVAHRRWREFLSPWISRLQNIELEQLLYVIDRLPAQSITPLSRAFAKNLLTYTYRRLREQT